MSLTEDKIKNLPVMEENSTAIAGKDTLIYIALDSARRGFFWADNETIRYLVRRNRLTPRQKTAATTVRNFRAC